MLETIKEFCIKNEGMLSIVFLIIWVSGSIGIVIYNHISEKKNPSGYSDPAGMFVLVFSWPVFLPILGVIYLFFDYLPNLIFTFIIKTIAKNTIKNMEEGHKSLWIKSNSYIGMKKNWYRLLDKYNRY